ncbi:MAG: HU family DNA-binding protein [Bacilli bacterium]|nr:HU family DNA-binding protein [Bacilli bacterium]
MNKAELIQIVSERVDVAHSDTEMVIEEFLSLIEKSIIKGEDVKLSGFGVFEKKQRKERKGTNPSDGRHIIIPASSTISFRPSKNFKAKVN